MSKVNRTAYGLTNPATGPVTTGTGTAMRGLGETRVAFGDDADVLTDARMATGTDGTVGSELRVDASARLPVLLFYGTAILWLLIGSLFAAVASIKFQLPDWLGSSAALTFGRVRPSHMNAVTYGWLSLAGAGTTVWVLARVLQTTVKGRALLVASAVLWNLGVLVGLAGIAHGATTGVEWLEMPVYAYALLIPAALLLLASSCWTILTRRTSHLYVSVWYLLAALIWFPMLAVVSLFPVSSGVVQSATNAWYAHNLVWLWFAPVAIASAYYFIPKVIGRPIYAYQLTLLGFWSYALVAGWGGLQEGPLPTWLVTVSVAASILMLIPIAILAVNHHMTLAGSFGAANYSPTLRFVVFGTVSLTVFGVMSAISSLRTMQATMTFTHYTVGQVHLGLYAFATMIAFGAMYYVVPQLTGRPWRHAGLIRLHLWFCGGGVALYVLAMTVGGIWQGRMMLDPNVPFAAVVNSTKAWLFTRSVAGVVMTLGHLIFAYLFGWNLLRRNSASDRTDVRTVPVAVVGATSEPEPTLLRQ